MTTAPRRFLALAVALCLSAAAAVPVLAHASLVSSTPADGAVVPSASATTLTLVFDDDLDATRSRVDLVDGGGSTVGTGHVAGDPRTMVLAGLSLAAGVYQARWTAMASDGDLTRGVVTFHVVAAGPSGGSTGDQRVSPIASTGPGSAGSASGSDVVLPIVAAALVVGGVGAWLLRRSRAA